MTYYHGSPVGGLTVLNPGKPAHFDKPNFVYMTSLYPMALMYGIQNFEYTYGYTRERGIYLDEYFPNALEELYGGKRAYIYICAPTEAEAGRIPNEWTSSKPVEIVDVIEIPDLLAEMQKQQLLGTLPLHRYESMPAGMLAWIKNAEADTIRKNGLLATPGPFADYMKRHYPESWSMVEQELKQVKKSFR